MYKSILYIFCNFDNVLFTFGLQQFCIFLLFWQLFIFLNLGKRHSKRFFCYFYSLIVHLVKKNIFVYFVVLTIGLKHVVMLCCVASCVLFTQRRKYFCIFWYFDSNCMLFKFGRKCFCILLLFWEMCVIHIYKKAFLYIFVILQHISCVWLKFGKRHFCIF